MESRYCLCLKVDSDLRPERPGSDPETIDNLRAETINNISGLVLEVEASEK